MSECKGAGKPMIGLFNICLISIRSEYGREEQTAGERNIPVSGNKLFPREEKNQIIMGKKIYLRRITRACVA